MSITTDTLSWPEALARLGNLKEFYVSWPAWDQLTEDQRASVEAGGKYPIVVS